jgi:prephenate dehydratase
LIKPFLNNAEIDGTREMLLIKAGHTPNGGGKYVGVPKEEINKASIKFELDDTPGSLATVLNVMNNCKLNLTKIQSMPIIEQPFKYSFFVDVIFEKYKHYEKAKNILALMTTHFKVLGEYKRGKQ